MTDQLQRGEKPDLWEIGMAYLNEEVDEKHREKLIEIGKGWPLNELDMDSGATGWDKI